MCPISANRPTTRTTLNRPLAWLEPRTNSGEPRVRNLITDPCTAASIARVTRSRQRSPSQEAHPCSRNSGNSPSEVCSRDSEPATAQAALRTNPEFSPLQIPRGPAPAIPQSAHVIPLRYSLPFPISGLWLLRSTSRDIHLTAENNSPAPDRIAAPARLAATPYSSHHPST